MKRIILKKQNSLYIKENLAIYCDFCGENNVMVFESEYDDDPKQNGNINMQICFDCVDQLGKQLRK